MAEREGNDSLKKLFLGPSSSHLEREEPMSLREERLLKESKDIIRHTLEEYRENSNKGKEKVISESYERNLGTTSFEIFRKFGATEFTGIAYFVAALVWIQNTEKVFRIAHVANEDKTNYASAMLTERARIWWSTTYKVFDDQKEENVPWESFKTAFLTQYCPTDVRSRLEKEFPELMQESMKIKEHETQVGLKAKFPMGYIPIERDMIQTCVESLRGEIREFVTNRGIPSFNDIVEPNRKRTPNHSANDILNPVSKRSRVDQAISTKLVEPSQSNSSNQTQFQNTSRMFCQNCKKYHRGRCDPNYGKVKCHGCGETGHIMFNCPSKNIKCYRCGEIGHYRRICSKRNHSCFLCEDVGHRHFECPHKSQHGINASIRQSREFSTVVKKEEVTSSG